MVSEPEKKWRIFAIVAVGIFMSTLDSSIVNVALPYIMLDLGTRMEMIQWVVMIYLLTISSLLLTFGRLSDIKGRRLVYCTGFIIFSAGSLLCALAAHPLVLVAARAIQGCGASMLMACSPAMIVDTFPQAERGKALGMVGAVVASGLTAGPVIGGLILDLLSWRFIFYINIPIGIVSAIAAARILKGTRADLGNNEPLDRTGGILLAVCLTCFLLAMTHLTDWGIGSPRTLLLIAGAALAGAGFIRTEISSRYPLFDLDLLKIRLFVFPVIAAAIAFASLFIIVFMMPFYLTHPCGLSPSATGFIMVTPFIMLFFVSPVAGALYNMAGSRLLSTAGMALIAVSLWLFTGIEPSQPMSAVVWRLGLAGLGMALFISPNSTAAMTAIPASQRGIASGTVATARNLGMVTGVALAGLVFNTVFGHLNNGISFQAWSDLVAPFFMKAFHSTMTAGTILACSGIVVSFLRGPDLPEETEKT